MPYINNFCFPPITFIGIPNLGELLTLEDYNNAIDYLVQYQDEICCRNVSVVGIAGLGDLTTVADYEAAIAYLQGVTVQAEACLTGCFVNISSITADIGDVERWILGTTGTTADGFLNITVAGDSVVEGYSNPNGDIPSIEIYHSFQATIASVLIFTRSLSPTGSPICSNTFTISSILVEQEIPTSGADTVIDIALLPTLPTCGGTISYYLIQDESGLVALNTVTGEVTITAGATTDPAGDYAYISQICTTDGLPSVLCVIAIHITNPLGLRLTYTTGNLPANALSDWNTFFDLPTNGTPFTSMSVVGDEVTLYGGSGITLATILFRNSELVKFEDEAGVVATVMEGVFDGSLSLTTVYLPIVLPNIGGSEGFDSVFEGCVSLTSVTVPIALATVAAGSPDEDLVYAATTLGATITYI